MAKALRTGLWITIVGIALTLQGCWYEEPDTLTLLGEGGCRTADGSEGEYVNVAAVSADECEAQCFTGEAACTAIEYNSNDGACEVHLEPIANYAEYAGVNCYAMR